MELGVCVKKNSFLAVTLYDNYFIHLINYQSDTLTSFVLQVIVILRMDCVLGLTHRILWKTSLIGQGVVAQHQVILQDQQLITQQEQRKVGRCFNIFSSSFVTPVGNFFLQSAVFVLEKIPALCSLLFRSSQRGNYSLISNLR